MKAFGSGNRRAAAGMVALGLMLAGCGGGDTEPADTPDSPSPSEVAVEEGVEVEGVTLPTPELSEVSIAVSSIDPQSLPIYIIENENLGEQFGLDVNVMTFEGPSQAQQAVIAGQVDLMDGSGGTAFNTAQTDDPMRLRYVYYDKMTDIFVGRQGVASAEDVRGQAVAVSSIGALSYAGAVLALKELGLETSDVTITQVGGDSARLAALQAGSVAAGIQAPTKRPTLEAEGFEVLVDLNEVDEGGWASGLLMPDSFVAENPNTALAVVAMYQAAHRRVEEDPEAAYAAWAKISDQPLEDATAEVEDWIAFGLKPLDGRCNTGALEFMHSVLIDANPDISWVDPTETCSDEQIDQLEELGFQKAVGVPGY